MKYENALIPNDKQMREFMEGDIDTPIYMVNLLKFKEKALYEDGRKTNLSERKLMQFMEWKSWST